MAQPTFGNVLPFLFREMPHEYYSEFQGIKNEISESKRGHVKTGIEMNIEHRCTRCCASKNNYYVDIDDDEWDDI